ncbi:hypothetical protein E8E13_001565 [Curvularia kusanoi]|uniref:Kelch repeat protein n=1 Tax=Curvularia kusanoi TaxID=90978 RepID=A0A9P4T2T8_CURKU|nr:hypothetical protein E8E13_001565 [Curvularia kusanoi]
MNTQTWSNHSYDSTPRAAGTMHYIPASASGMLVYFGGVETDSTGAVRQHIRIFDINENKWFTETATGDVPTPRQNMCAVVAWADDRSSYNMYEAVKEWMYFVLTAKSYVQGGVREDGATFGETYILTIPSSQWKLIYPEPNRLPNVAAGKGWSSCNTVRGNSQMMMIGGYFANVSFTQCDVPKYMGQHGLLLEQESEEVAPPETKWWWRLWRQYIGSRESYGTRARLGNPFAAWAVL